jgi:hypothetical protein
VSGTRPVVLNYFLWICRANPADIHFHDGQQQPPALHHCYRKAIAADLLFKRPVQVRIAWGSRRALELEFGRPDPDLSWTFEVSADQASQ